MELNTEEVYEVEGGSMHCVLENEAADGGGTLPVDASDAWDMRWGRCD